LPTAHTRIPTDRAGRYLAQLCQHLNQISGHPLHGGASPIRRVEWSDSHGVIEFASGTCTLDATGDELALTLVASDADDLRQLQQLLSARLETIGRRDDIHVTW
jgi:hypothetical protein